MQIFVEIPLTVGLTAIFGDLGGYFFGELKRSSPAAEKERVS